jgi:methyl coenzyme M reductase beta subunit
MKSPTMLYKPGNQYHSDGIDYTVKTVDASEVEQALEDGWFTHFSEFGSNKTEFDADTASLEQLKAKAKELGVTMAHNIGAKSARNKIKEALQ